MSSTHWNAQTISSESRRERRRASTRARVVFGATISLFVGCADPAPLGLGAYCSPSEPDRCESGMCEISSGGLGICTQVCSEASPCPSSTDLGALTCNPATGVCDTACTLDEVLIAGATTYVCRSHDFVACDDLTDVDCAFCGCDVFGGGVCLPVGGCVDPKADGQSCTYHEECISGTCYYDTQICGAARALNDPCYADEDCESKNCSNDGEHAVAGVCNMAFGDVCTDTTDCDNCVGATVYGEGLCIRTYCNPDDPNPCPRGIYTGYGTYRNWDCLLSSGGDYLCYEDCSSAASPYSYSCLDPFDLCHEDWSGSWCY